MCPVTLGHDEVQGCTYPRSVTSLYVLQRSRSLQLSIPGHSSAPSISHESGRVGRSPQLHQLCCCLLQADLYLPTLWLSLWLLDLPAGIFSHPISRGLLSSHLAHPNLNAWPRTSCVISSPALPVVCYYLPLCQSPHIFYLLLAAIFSQGKNPQWHMGIQGEHLPPASLIGTLWAPSTDTHHPHLGSQSHVYNLRCVQPFSLQEGMAINLTLLCNVS